MGYIEFQTKNADYIFNGINHLYSRINLGKLEGIDAIVTEASMYYDYESFSGFFGRALFGTFFGNRDIIKFVADNKIPVFSVDVNTFNYDKEFPTGEGTLLENIKLMYHDLQCLPHILETVYYSCSGKEIPLELLDKTIERGRKEKEPCVDGRDALSSEKLENYLVPLISKIQGIKRPRVGVIYGFEHAGMIEYLKDEKLRKESIEYYQRTGFKGLNKHDINEIVSYDVTHDGFTTKKKIDMIMLK